MALTVILVENVPSNVTGATSRWLHQVGAGLFIGHLSARVRDELWDGLLAGSDEGRVLMAWATSSEQGFEIRTHGIGRYRPIDLDGVTLMGIGEMVTKT